MHRVVAALFVALLIVARPLSAAEVVLDGVTATAIRNLEVHGKLYDVSFVRDSFNDLQAVGKLPFVGAPSGARIARGLIAELLDGTPAVNAGPDSAQGWRNWKIPREIYGNSNPVWLGGDVDYQPSSNRWSDGANAAGSLDSDDYFIAFTELTPATVAAELDPWSSDDSVRPNSAESLVVAVLGQSAAAGDPVDFDVASINQSAFGFGEGRAANIAQSALQGDYDGDGVNDAAFVFRTQDTGIACGDTMALLRGEMVDGAPFAAQVSLVTADCSPIPEWAPGKLIVSETYPFYAVDDGDNDNDVFVMNLLGGGNRVLIHEPNYWWSKALDEFYNGQPGVTSERYSGEITAYKLKGVSVLYLHIGLNDPVFYSAEEIAVMKRFLYTGGTIVFAAVSSYNFYNFDNWNAFLQSMGSSMYVSALDQNPSQGAHFAPIVVAGPLTEGVTDFTVGAGNDWHGGIGIVKEGVYRLVVYENFRPKMPSIDVDPWSAADEVDPDTDESVVVAILGSSTASGDVIDFDVARIDPVTLQLGVGQAPNIALSPLYGDYDSDTNQDAAFTFSVSASGIACEDTEVELTGGTLDGEAFSGVGAIVTPDCAAASCHP